MRFKKPRSVFFGTFGTDEAKKELKDSYTKSFVVGSFGMYEYDFFLFIKDINEQWYVYRDDCEKMLLINDISKLRLRHINKIDSKFKKIGVSSGRYGYMPS